MEFQLEEYHKKGENAEEEGKEPPPNPASEDNAIEMSEDFTGALEDQTQNTGTVVISTYLIKAHYHLNSFAHMRLYIEDAV